MKLGQPKALSNTKRLEHVITFFACTTTVSFRQQSATHRPKWSNSLLGVLPLKICNIGTFLRFVVTFIIFVKSWSTEELEVLTPQSTLSYHPYHALRLAYEASFNLNIVSENKNYH